MALLDIFKSKPLTKLSQWLSYGSSSRFDEGVASTERDNCDPRERYYYSLEDIYTKLPFIAQAANTKTKLINSQGYDFICTDTKIEKSTNAGIIKKREEDKAKLKAIFNRLNDVGQSLDDLIFDAIEATEGFGHAGLQAFDWASPDKIIFQSVNWNQFMMVLNKLSSKDRGRKKLNYYYISLDGFADERGIQLVKRADNVTSTVDSERYYKLLPHEFIHLRLNNKTLYGLSPLFFDQLMTKFIIKSLENNIEELDGNGWKGLLLKGRNGINAQALGINDENGDNWQNRVIDKFIEKVRSVAKDPKDKQFLMYLNGALVEDVIQLQKNYKSVEYMDKVDAKASVLAASMVGIHPALLGDRDSTYATNTKPVVEYTVNYSITPSQLKYGEMVTSQILDRYINGTGYLNYTYKFIYNPIDLADPKVEAEIFDTLGAFVSKLRAEGIATVNESVRFINDHIKNINLEEEDLNGDIKTTNYEPFPLNFEPEVDRTPTPADETDETDPVVDEEESDLSISDKLEIKDSVTATLVDKLYREINE